jgi:membrane protease YdiL (CAAX protease family)
VTRLSAHPEDITDPAQPGVFFALAFVWSWACWLLSARLNAGSPVAANTLFFIGGFGPSLAAVAVVAHGGGRAGLQRWLQRCLQWREGWRWMLLAFLFPVAFMGLAATLHVALGGTLPPSPAVGHLPMVVTNFFLVFLVGGPLGEEFGWRGYALPELQKRWGWRRTSLLLGVVWAVWHLPLFYIAGTPQSQTPVVTFTASAIALSVLFAWLSKRTRQSVWPALVLHTAINAWPSVIPIIPSSDNPRPYQLVVGLLVAIAIGLFFSIESSKNPV